EQRAVPVRRFAQLLEEIADRRTRVERVELREALDVGRYFRMMREIVERIVDTALGINTVADLACDHQRSDARDLGLPGEGQQIEHQFRMRDEAGRYADGLARHVEIPDRRFARQLQAALDLADVFEIALETGAVRRSQPALQRGRVVDDGIEQALLQVHARGALFGRAAVAEQALEYDLWVLLHRQRRLGRAVRNGAAVVERQLQRRHRRVLPDVLRDELVERRRGG